MILQKKEIFTNLIFKAMKTTEENNKMIAEFIGLEKHGEHFILTENLKYYSHEEKSWINYALPKHLKYHSSWDWLMPVVTKITTQDKYIGLMQRENIMDTVPYGLIEDTYNYVVQFIEWYNTNKG